MAAKQCTKCGNVQPLSAYYSRKTSSDGLRAQCKTCESARNSRYVERHREKIAAYKAEWRKPHAEKYRAQAKAIYLSRPGHCNNNSAEWAKRNRPRVRAVKAAWKQRNPAAVLADAGYRRAVKLRATPAWADPTAIARMYAEAVARGMEVDHVVPLRSRIVCGLHCEANLQLMCRDENTRKNNRHWPDGPME